jgi:asparagine synthase (glutamine-hydrolysing)
MGFPVPFALWLRGPWKHVVEDVLLDSRTRQRGIIETSSVARLIDAHAAGATNAGDVLWTLMNLELWYRTFIDGAGVQQLAPPTSVRQAAPAELRASA